LGGVYLTQSVKGSPKNATDNLEENQKHRRYKTQPRKEQKRRGGHYQKGLSWEEDYLPVIENRRRRRTQGVPKAGEKRDKPQPKGKPSKQVRMVTKSMREGDETPLTQIRRGAPWGGVTKKFLWRGSRRGMKGQLKEKPWPDRAA